jgi:hypothetical protein
MNKPATSPDRYTFTINNYIRRCKQEGNVPREDYLELYRSDNVRDEENLRDPEWQKNNLEWDLRTTQWIVDKVCQNPVYAQHLYAALCNMQWVKDSKTWHCSWRYAGGIVAHMNGKGDYIDYYCSGINDMERPTLEYWISLTPEQEQYWSQSLDYVGEGCVTNEIKQDLALLGWTPQEWEYDESSN